MLSHCYFLLYIALSHCHLGLVLKMFWLLLCALFLFETNWDWSVRFSSNNWAVRHTWQPAVISIVRHERHRWWDPSDLTLFGRPCSTRGQDDTFPVCHTVYGRHYSLPKANSREARVVRGTGVQCPGLNVKTSQLYYRVMLEFFRTCCNRQQDPRSSSKVRPKGEYSVVFARLLEKFCFGWYCNFTMCSWKS